MSFHLYKIEKKVFKDVVFQGPVVGDPWYMPHGGKVYPFVQVPPCTLTLHASWLPLLLQVPCDVGVQEDNETTNVTGIDVL